MKSRTELPLKTKTKKNNDNQETYFDNRTEEATTMGADTEAISIEVPSGLLNHVTEFQSKALSKSIKDHKNTGIVIEKAGDMKDSD